jgi:hypothetical protein
MNRLVYPWAILTLAFVCFSLTLVQAQEVGFEAFSPAAQHWNGEPYYTDSKQLDLAFGIAEKKISTVSLLNQATSRELYVSKFQGRFEKTIILAEGENQILVRNTKKKPAFEKRIVVVYQPGGVRIPETAASQIRFQLGDPQLQAQADASGDWVVLREDREDFDLNFSLSGCDEKKLELFVENPRNRAVKVKGGKKNLYRFPVKIYQEDNLYTLRVNCNGKEALTQRIRIKIGDSFMARKDTAIIFAVTKHQRTARKQGWDDLQYSLNDALALQWTLENKFGFGTKLMLDPTWEEINDCMQRLKAHPWGLADQLFIFFTGHGHKTEDGTGYLIPSNAGASIKTYYKMEDLRDQIDGIACNNISLLIDACFAASFLERGGKDVVALSSRSGSDTHRFLSTTDPFRYFIGSAPSNREVPEKGIYLKESQKADSKYKYAKKKFKVSAFMMSFLLAVEMGEERYAGQAIPIWFVGRKVEELYRPRKQGKGYQVHARATRFGSQHDKGFHFIPTP